MPSTSATPPSAQPASRTVGEIISEACLDDLNRSLADQGVDASQIIAIFKIPGQPIANASRERYRVLYRKI